MCSKPITERVCIKSDICVHVFKFSNLSCAQRDLSASDIVPSSLPATICTYMYLLVATDFARDGQALPSELL